MRIFVYFLIVLLAIVHQDFWWWDTEKPLIGGVVPIGLAYHALVSLAAAIFWGLAAKYCWPHDLDDDDAITAGNEGAAS
ncbi:MAG TPA: hypothetical protein PKN33_05120 [Phycisphaerae bacterium]|nr:hypothetical protein [Phycisphaerae bacterium]